jgi:hypothetical protein
MSYVDYVATSGDILYYTNVNTHAVTCCNLHGTTQWKFKDNRVLHGPLGISVDNNGNVYVVDHVSRNIVVISPDGQRRRQLLSSNNDLSNPGVLDYDKPTSRLLVVNQSSTAFFQQVVGISMGTNCAPLLVDLFLCSYESEFLQKLVKDEKIHEARAFNFTYRYVDDALSINYSRFAEFLPLIYPPQLEVKETTDTASPASILDLNLEFDESGQLSTKIYDKRDDFNFKIINFPNMCSNIPASPAYGVYISQLIRYARASSNYSNFLKRHLHLRNRRLDQGYEKIRLIRSLKKSIFRYQDLVEIYSVSAETIISDAFSYTENV